MFSLPYIVGISHGFYRGEGLQAELIVMAPSVAIQSLIAEEIDFASPFSSSTRAAIAGMSIRNVMVVMTGSDQVLVVRPEIKRVEDLKGKILGVSSLKSTTDLSTRILLKKYGLVPDADVKIIALGGGSGLRLAALEGKRIDGTLLAMPQNKMAVKMGFRELVYMKDLIGIPYVGLSTNTRKMQKDPDTIVRAIRATLKAIRFIKENKEEILKVMAKELGIKDREVAALVYDDATKLYSDTGIPSEASMLEDIAVAKETQGVTRKVSISDVADWGFAREASRQLK
jgi:NitT/TauT family transport system substrate-binding protein